MANVSVRKLVKAFGAAAVLKGIDVDVRDGEFLSLVGPSGCGKSTLLRMIAGLEQISGGEIAIDGKVVNELAAKDRDIAMVFQNYALYPHMTVRENMSFALEMRGMSKAEMAQRVDTAAAVLGLGELLDRYPRQMSGGQQQRVAMGRAIVRNPKVFLFDEPLSNLDAKLRGEVRTEIKALSQQLKTTMIFVTHDQVEAMTMADRIVVLKAGVVQQFGTPEEVYKSPANQFVAGFIGSPTMNFFDVNAEGANVRMDEGVLFPMPPRCGGVAGPAVLGVRPEHMRVLPADAPGLRVQVSVVEPLGSDTLVYFDRAGKRHVARVAPELQVGPRDTITLDFDMDKCHLFDKNDGAVLR
jgi:multiple sugar transport system ATP-binding protein